MQTSETGIRVLIARTIIGPCVVLTTNSTWITDDCENISYGCDDVGLDEPPVDMEGTLFLWEGNGKLESYQTADGHEPPEPNYTGTIRPVTMEELPALMDMAPPCPPELEEEFVQSAVVRCTFGYTVRRADAEEFIEIFPGAKLVAFEDAAKGQYPVGRIEVPRHRAEEFVAYAECDVVVSKAQII